MKVKLLPNVAITARSGNAKTGDIPVTYRPVDTCPTDCPFLPTGAIGGCYGTGRLLGMARKNASDMTYADALAKLQHRAPNARYMRDRVVGDVITPRGRVDHAYISAIASLAADIDVTAYGYTHAWRRFTPADVSRVARSGYVMNASCETPADVRDAIGLGMPAVIASDSIAEGTEFVRSDGSVARVVTCPAQTRAGITCATCGLCAKPQRKAIVRFLIHGTARKRAAAAVAAVELADTGATLAA